MVTAFDGWTPARFDETPVAGEIDVWGLDLSLAAPDDAALKAALTASEAAETARFLRPEDRRQRALARVFLRWVLGNFYLSRPPREVCWTRDVHGRPRLDPSAGCSLDFNLSHAGSHVLVAVSADDRVGIDVEARVALDATALARICATEAEQRWLAAAADDAERTLRFLRLWTMKEAVLKCHGLGLGCDPRRCAVDADGGRAGLTLDDEPPRLFTVAVLPFPPGTLGAVAWPGATARSARLRRAPPGWLDTAFPSRFITGHPTR